MKKRFNHILIWIVFVIVLTLSLFVLFQYWKFTKNNNVESKLKDDINNSDIYILEDSDIPTVFSYGELSYYKIVQNELDGNIQLYIIISTNDGYLPVKVDNIAVVGKNKPKYFVLENLNDNDKKEISLILEEVLEDPSLVDHSYVDISSIQNFNQLEICISSFANIPNDWCKFNLDDDSYSKDELLDLIKNYLDKDIHNLVFYGKEDFSKFLSIDTNLTVVLQVNYRLDLEEDAALYD